MNEHEDLERTLQSFTHEADPAVRRAALDAWARPATASWWRRPVPLYAVAALLVVAVGLSLAWPRGNVGTPAVTPSGAEVSTAASPTAALTWTTAARDQI